MTSKYFVLWFGLLGLAVTMGCGGSSMRTLQSVTVSSAAVDAMSSPNGHIQFMAADTFSAPPSPVLLNNSSITWCIGSMSGMCDEAINPNAVIAQIDASGVAHCNPGMSAVAIVIART